MNLGTKEQVLQKSYETQGTGRIQVRKDMSKADQTKRTKLYKEIQAWQENIKIDIMIQDGKMLSKTFYLLPLQLRWNFK